MAVTNNAANNSVLNNFQTVESQTTTTAGAQLVLVKNRALGAIQTGDTIGTIQYIGQDNASTNIITSQINSVCSGTVGANRVASDLEFYTHPDSAGASTQRMVIDSKGDVTINAPDSGVALTIVAGGETITAGDLTITAGNILMSNTNTGATSGIIKFGGNRFISNYGTSNTFIGQSSGNTSLTVGSAIGNTGGGINSLQSLTTGNDNTAWGVDTLQLLTTGIGNTAIGYQSLDAITTASGNTALGINTGSNVAFNGAQNVLLGYFSGNAYSGTESSNIIIGSVPTVGLGTVGDNNITRIGVSGSGSGQQNKCFIGGIDGVNVGSVARVVTEASDQLGTAVITAGTGITVTPGANTITISASGTSTLTYTNVNTTPYVVLSSDEYLSVDTSALAITVQLPNAPSAGRIFIIKDRTGAAFTRNISVTTVGGAVTIDGSTTYTMNTNLASIQVIFNGSAYEIF